MPREHPRRWTALAALAALATLGAATACGSAARNDTPVVTVDIGYQSKTINTVTAGTLLRSLGYF
jgi:NitT/TauT family transport system substrate-binding protein